MTDAEIMMWNAVRSALNYDELISMEAVIRTVKPHIPYLSDEALAETLAIISRYVENGKSGNMDAHFIPEWADMQAWLTEEKQIRDYIKQRIVNNESECKEGAV